MLHSDCGAYGGLEAFCGDIHAEQENHKAELERATQFLRNSIPGIEVESYYVDFEGVWVLRSELARRAAPPPA